MKPDEHRHLREMLGALALGHLSTAEETAVRAHLEGCADCRRDLADISPLARELATVDVRRVSSVPTPSPSLGLRVQAAVAGERRRRGELTRRRNMLLAAAAVVALLLVGGAGVEIGRRVGDAPAATALIEPVEVSSTLDEVQASAGLVAHTWGTEIKLEAVGLRSGSAYAVVVTTEDGNARSAGAFVGTGAQVMNCNLNTDVLRAEAVGFRVLDEEGRAVLTAEL